ncbi:MAG TPA: hypothetical protein DFR83_17925 [Deltaproteobacteria bacterium]|nr:hypothetical protein [Deltaproteobacteria bacterium]
MSLWSAGRLPAWVLGLAAACSEASPPVPPPLSPDAQAQGAMVQFETIQGYLARPHSPDTERRVEIWRMDALELDTQYAARVRASGGLRVFVVAMEHDVATASRYMEAVPPLGLQASVCIQACQPPL